MRAHHFYSGLGLDASHLGLAQKETMGSSLVLLPARSSSDLVLAPEKDYD